MDPTSLEGRVRDLEAALRSARKDETEAERRLAAARAATQAWQRLAEDLRQGHYADALLVLVNGRDVFDSPGHDAPRQLALDLRSELTERARDRTAGFAREFPPLAREAGLEIDRTSRHPNYTLLQGFLHVDLDERRSAVRLQPRDGTPLELGADARLVVERIVSEIKRITDRPLDSDALLRSLHTAYQAVLRSESKPEGDELPLRRVTNRLAKNLNRFAGDEFNYDLARLLRQGQVVIDGKRLQLNHTRNARQGMLLHGMEAGGYVGFVSFKKEDQG